MSFEFLMCITDLLISFDYLYKGNVIRIVMFICKEHYLKIANEIFGRFTPY